MQPPLKSHLIVAALKGELSGAARSCVIDAFEGYQDTDRDVMALRLAFRESEPTSEERLRLLRVGLSSRVRAWKVATLFALSEQEGIDLAQVGGWATFPKESRAGKLFRKLRGRVSKALLGRLSELAERDRLLPCALESTHKARLRAREAYAQFLQHRSDPLGDALAVWLTNGARRTSPTQSAGSSIDPAVWFAVTWPGAISVQNCPAALREQSPRLEFTCPLYWEHLQATEQESVRQCGQCNKRVYRCQDADEVRMHARAGHCVALPSALALSASRDFGAKTSKASKAPIERIGMMRYPLRTNKD